MEQNIWRWHFRYHLNFQISYNIDYVPAIGLKGNPMVSGENSEWSSTFSCDSLVFFLGSPCAKRPCIIVYQNNTFFIDNVWTIFSWIFTYKVQFFVVWIHSLSRFQLPRIPWILQQTQKSVSLRSKSGLVILRSKSNRNSHCLFRFGLS